MYAFWALPLTAKRYYTLEQAGNKQPGDGTRRAGGAHAHSQLGNLKTLWASIYGGDGSKRLKDVQCICGEYVVFLDPEVEVKTCPNCGLPVRQDGEAAGSDTAVRRRFVQRRPVKKRHWLIGLVLGALIAAALVGAFKFVAASALAGAGREFERAEAAMAQKAYHTAAARYQNSLAIYKRWGALSELTDKVEAALAEAKLILAESAEMEAAEATLRGTMPISLEELARQVHYAKADQWQKAFMKNYTGRWVIIRSTVEQGRAREFKASALTVSYKVFSPSGEEVEISFDGPFFERYRLTERDDCLVRVVLSRMEFDRGGPGETGRWVLVADSSRSTLVTDRDELEETGWKVDEELEKLISRQRSLSPAY